MNRNIKNVVSLMLLFISLVAFSQEEGYNENYQIKKINSELAKHYNKSSGSKYFYKIISIKNDTLRMDKFTYRPYRVWDELYIPLKSINPKSIKYKKGILVKTKKKKKTIGDHLDKRPKPKKYYGIKIHPQAGEEKDKEIMELFRVLFENHK